MCLCTELFYNFNGKRFEDSKIYNNSQKYMWSMQFLNLTIQYMFFIYIKIIQRLRPHPVFSKLERIIPHMLRQLIQKLHLYLHLIFIVDWKQLSWLLILPCRMWIICRFDSTAMSILTPKIASQQNFIH